MSYENGENRKATATKQVIVMRKDLQMRKGKMVAQGAHASMAWMMPWIIGSKTREDLTSSQWWWVEGLFTKICVSVDSEEELLAIKAAAEVADVECHLIQDNGLTEFSGIPTYTCLALGPDDAGRIDALTGHLKLL